MNELKLLIIAVNAALKAGNAILGVYYSEDHEIQGKSDLSPLTLADRRSNEIILEELKQTGIPVVSEESLQAPYEVRKDWNHCWIVDPLDGTKEFIKRNDEFTVNIALVHHGKPVIGVIFTPVTGELYYAGNETGAWKYVLPAAFTGDIPAESLPEASRRLPDPGLQKEHFTVVASRSHRNRETDEFIGELGKQYGEMETLSRGSSLKICMVAEGAADIYPRFAPTMEWDTAAGHAIAANAGCSFIDPATGRELTYNKENLTNPWFIVKRKI